MVNHERLMVKREHLRLRRELLDIASGAVPGLSLRAERTRLTASLSADGITFSALPSILARMRRTGDRHIADAIPCLPESNSSTPTTAAARVCACGGARL